MKKSKMVKRRSDLATATSPEDGEDSSRDDTSLVGREASDSGSAQLANTDAQEAASSPSPAGRAPRLQRVVVFAALPIVTLGVTAVAGYLKYQAESMRASDAAAVESVRAATDGAIKILSYHADSADKDLAAARDGLTGSFRDDYTKLTRDVVIPGARQKSISTVASVPAAALMSASAEHAQVLVFIDQTVSMGTEPPTSTSSSVKVTLDKQSGRWLISGFDPI